VMAQRRYSERTFQISRRHRAIGMKSGDFGEKAESRTGIEIGVQEAHVSIRWNVLFRVRRIKRLLTGEGKEADKAGPSPETV